MAEHRAPQKPHSLTFRLAVHGPSLIASGTLMGLTTTMPLRSRAWNPQLFHVRYPEGDAFAAAFALAAIVLGLLVLPDIAQQLIGRESKIAGDMAAQYILPWTARVAAWLGVVFATWQFSPVGDGSPVASVIAVWAVAIITAEFAVAPALQPTQLLRDWFIARLTKSQQRREAAINRLQTRSATHTACSPVRLFTIWSGVVGVTAVILWILPLGVHYGPSFFDGWQTALGYVAVLIVYFGAASAGLFWFLTAGFALVSSVRVGWLQLSLRIAFHVVPISILGLVGALIMFNGGSTTDEASYILLCLTIFGFPYAAVLAALHWKRGPAAWRWSQTTAGWQRRIDQSNDEIKRLRSLELAA